MYKALTVVLVYAIAFIQLMQLQNKVDWVFFCGVDFCSLKKAAAENQQYVLQTQHSLNSHINSRLLLFRSCQTIMWKLCSADIDRGVLCGSNGSETKSMFVHKYLYGVHARVCVFFMCLSVCVSCTRHFSLLD